MIFGAELFFVSQIANFIIVNYCLLLSFFNDINVAVCFGFNIYILKPKALYICIDIIFRTLTKTQFLLQYLLVLVILVED